MKHITLPALAIAGAMTLAVVPAADAQSSGGSSAVSAGATTTTASTTAAAPLSSATGQEDMKPLNPWVAGGVAGQWEGVDWYYHTDKQHVVLKIEDVAKDLSVVNPDNVLTVKDFADQAGYQRPGTTSEPTTSPAPASSQLSSEMLPFARVGEVVGELNGSKWYYNRDINYVVNSQDLVNRTVTQGEAGVKLTIDFAREIQRSLPINVVVDGLSSNPAPGTPTAPAAPQGSSGNGTQRTENTTETTNGTTNAQLNAGSSQLGRLVQVALPAILIIGGISWFLNNDGMTYMQSSSRTGETPTEQERASSMNMLSSNRSEVQRQSSALGSSALGSSALGSSALGSSGQGSNNGDQTQATAEDEFRGIGAETGSNGFARGLFALLLASVLGAAAFHFGRKQLV
ncbi:hypothetical protein [Corynebacterium sp. UBA2622]|uniref:hypothetical protein n=1 Tax=Corynebacterium sp. UBA2622 TaxID=1946393 RepID=UPI0025BFCA3D|nr:hypothetical protein [Corynebacterium sp. UBA2622]